MAPLPIKFTELVNVRLARYPFFSVAAAAALVLCLVLTFPFLCCS